MLSHSVFKDLFMYPLDESHFKLPLDPQPARSKSPVQLVLSSRVNAKLVSLLSVQGSGNFTSVWGEANYISLSLMHRCKIV